MKKITNSKGQNQFVSTVGLRTANAIQGKKNTDEWFISLQYSGENGNKLLGPFSDKIQAENIIINDLI